MHNLPVKFALMSMPYQALSPQMFLDLSPESCMALFKATLPRHARQVLEFALTDQAVLLILEHEFTVPVGKPQLMFVKPYLDGESWLFANGFSTCPELPPDLESHIDDLAYHIWLQTAHCSIAASLLLERAALQRLLKVLLTLYVLKFGKKSPQALYALESPLGLKRFFNLVVAEAVYKADAARILFGWRSAYYQHWLSMQYQFLMVAKDIEKSGHQKIA